VLSRRSAANSEGNSKLPRKLDFAANVAIVVVAALLAGILASRVLHHQHPPGRVPYRVGEVVPRLASLSYAGADQTLLISFKPGCRFCNASIGFYRALAAQAGPRVQVVAISPDATQESDAYLRTRGLTVGRVFSIDLGVWRITGFPTLLLVDREGIVLNAWTGQLTKQGEADVFAALGVPTATR
jgi:hypothetical protein